MSRTIGILIALLGISLGVEAATSGELSPMLREEVSSLVAADASRITAIYKDIHQNPELGFMEYRTAGIVVKELEALGFEVSDGIGKTGVMAILRNGDGPTVLYRADMDANSVEETTGLPYASDKRVEVASGEVPVAHMCGHDAHVTWMLGMARAMLQLKQHWSGTLVLVAQPAEELIAGAAAMVEDGLYGRHGMPKPDYLIALHTVPLILGSILSVEGVRYAGTDQLDVTFRGVPGHGSMPHLTKDPVLMAASAVVQYQSIVSRHIDPLQSAVLTVGSIQAGHDNNVIPDSALLKLNLRWFSHAVRQQLLEGIERVNHSIATANNLPEDLYPITEMKGHSGPLVNDPALTARLATSLGTAFDPALIIERAPPAMASEDAHLLLGDLVDVPVAYLMIGVASPVAFAAAGNRPPYFPHNGNYVVDLAAIPLGAHVATLSVLELLSK